MKKQISIAFFAGMLSAGLVASLFLAGQAREARRRNAVILNLTRQVEYLSQSAVDLRKQIAATREQQARTLAAAQMAPAKETAPAPAPLGGNPPERTWQPGNNPPGQPFEFNGRTYYLTPLGDKSLVAK